jgi:Eco29kI restriction endonuclease
MTMKLQAFDRSKHVYRNDAFVELVKDAIRFFHGTPVHTLPPPESFTGTGVYALYYTGQTGIYQSYGEINRLAYNTPIYIGKAVPKGWRQGRDSDDSLSQSKELHTRLGQHSNNIAVVKSLKLADFQCRFVIFEDAGSDMIGAIEASLIKLHKPLWNVVLDGFGNHDPGKGRYQQAKSDWDVVHAGRVWADRCVGVANDKAAVLKSIKTHLSKLVLANG